MALLATLALVVVATVQEPGFDVARYELSLRVEPDTKVVRGSAKVTVAARDQAVAEARFALNEALPLGRLTRDGKALQAKRGERIAEGRAWTVPFEPPLAAGKSCELVFEYEGQGVDPDDQGSDWMGIVLVRADEVRMSHQAQWYPIVPRDADARSKLAAPLQLELDLPAGLESLGPGTLEGVRKQKGRELHRWSSERPVQASILAGKFKAQTIQRGKIAVRAVSFPDHAAGAKAWAEDAAQSIDALRRSLGELELATYGLGEMRIRNRAKSYNYEADGFSVYDGVLFDGRAPDAKKIAHEVAHLWFGGVADASGPGERFLTEGMAEHAAWTCVETRNGDAAAIAAARNGLERYFGSPGPEAPLAEADFRSPRYSQVAYSKGAFALRTLRATIGAEAFDAGLRDYLAQAKSARGAATLESFSTALRTRGGAAFDAWAEDWLRRSGTPTFRVELTGDARGTLLQSGELYRQPVELELRLAQGKPHTIRVTPTQLAQPWTADIAGKIESVTIDPRFLILFQR